MQAHRSTWFTIGMPSEIIPPKDLEATRQLIASVEELRALLAPLSDEDRRRVLDLARSLRQQPDEPA
jgi:hypothetical protein